MKVEIGIRGFKLSDLAAACNGYLVGADRTVQYVCTDSREADDGTLFVALHGERTDGHAYILQTLQHGCRAVLCEAFPSLPEALDASALIVPNTAEALLLLAGDYLDKRSLLRVAVTGSVGKTTTKEFLCAVLQQRFQTYKTEANYNSTIGMPVSALGVSEAHRAAVFEMGMSGRGEIAALSRIVRPDVALITNVGSSHLEFLKTRENIAQAKLEIVCGLKEGGLLLLNGDEPLLRGVVLPRARVRTVAVHSKGDYSVSDVDQHPDLWQSTFSLSTPDGRILRDLCIPAIGTHMVHDAAYAVAVGLELGMEEQSIRQGLMSYQSEAFRQRLVRVGQVTLLADCYNAAPESMCEALHVLASYAAAEGGRAFAVLGDMRELGEYTRRMHESVGAEVAGLGLSGLITLGELGVSIAEGAIGAGMAEERICSFRSLDDLMPAAQRLWEMLRSGDVVLLKASRGVRAERVIEALRELEAQSK